MTKNLWNYEGEEEVHESDLLLMSLPETALTFCFSSTPGMRMLLRPFDAAILEAEEDED